VYDEAIIDETGNGTALEGNEKHQRKQVKTKRSDMFNPPFRQDRYNFFLQSYSPILWEFGGIARSYSHLSKPVGQANPCSKAIGESFYGAAFGDGGQRISEAG
jgi:hypothetical protein